MYVFWVLQVYSVFRGIFPHVIHETDSYSVLKTGVLRLRIARWVNWDHSQIAFILVQHISNVEQNDLFMVWIHVSTKSLKKTSINHMTLQQGFVARIVISVCTSIYTASHPWRRHSSCKHRFEHSTTSFLVHFPEWKRCLQFLRCVENSMQHRGGHVFRAIFMLQILRYRFIGTSANRIQHTSAL